MVEQSYTTKTVSQTYTITLVSDTVKIEANKDTVVRSKPFSVTITGRPNQAYNVWVKGTSTMHGGYDDQPPQFQSNQAGTLVGDPNHWKLYIPERWRRSSPMFVTAPTWYPAENVALPANTERYSMRTLLRVHQEPGLLDSLQRTGPRHRSTPIRVEQNFGTSAGQTTRAMK